MAPKRSMSKIQLFPLASQDVCVCIIGVGYVGESLLKLFGNVENSIGFDVSFERVATLKLKYLDSAKVQLTTHPADLAKGTHFLISVPTPLKEDHSVNLECVISALKLVAEHAQPGSCVVIESSVPVGTTRKLLGPYKGIFNCGMSPERIDPGRLLPTAEDIPKVVSGLTPKALKQIVALYGKVYQTIIPVTKPEVAEMTKLYENCYRMVNIAYVNEISDACQSHGIDPHEVIGAAATKPFGFQPFYPGLGVGGHCLPVNPWYLFQNNRRLRVLEVATKLMMDRPHLQARRFYRHCQNLENYHKDARTSLYPRILVVGLGFKSGQSNVSSSPALSFAHTLRDMGCNRLAFYDPTIQKETVSWMEKLIDQNWTSAYIEAEFDGVALCNTLDVIDVGVLDKLQRTLVKRYV